MLEELIIINTCIDITNIDVSIFSKLKTLRCNQLLCGIEKLNLLELSTNYPDIMSHPLNPKTYPSIKILSLEQHKYSDSTPNIAKYFPNLERLCLSGDMNSADLNDLNISHLILDFDFSEQIPHFNNLINLKSLNISGFYGSLRSFVNLTELIIASSTLNKYDLLDMNKLLILEIFEIRVSNDIIQDINKQLNNQILSNNSDYYSDNSDCDSDDNNQILSDNSDYDSDDNDYDSDKYGNNYHITNKNNNRLLLPFSIQSLSIDYFDPLMDRYQNLKVLKLTENFHINIIDSIKKIVNLREFSLCLYDIVEINEIEHDKLEILKIKSVKITLLKCKNLKIINIGIDSSIQNIDYYTLKNVNIYYDNYY